MWLGLANAASSGVAVFSEAANTVNSSISEAANTVNATSASMRQNKRKGIICFDASLRGPKNRGGWGERRPQTKCSNDGFGKDSDRARLTKAGRLRGSQA